MSESLSEQLTALREKAEKAAEKWRDERRKASDPYPRVREALKDVAEYRHGLETRKHEEDEELERKLNQELQEKLASGDLRIRPLTAGSAGVVEIVDLEPTRKVNQAAAAMYEAREAVQNFEKSHEAELLAERKQAEADQLTAALHEGDIDSVREVLGASN